MLAETREAAARSARSAWVGRLGRFGFAAQGASLAIVAVLALALALGQGGKATDPQGAFVTLAQYSWGKVLLVLLTFGFASYALWRFAQAFFDRGREGTGLRGLGKRGVQLAQGCAYAGLALAAVRVIRGATPNSQRSAKAAAADVLSVALAVGNAYWGVSERFRGSLRIDDMSPQEERLASRLGKAGFLSFAVVLGLVGWFLVDAAREHRSDTAVTLEGALSRIAHASYGARLLALTAAGLLAFGLFVRPGALPRRVAVTRPPNAHRGRRSFFSSRRRASINCSFDIRDLPGMCASWAQL